PMYWLIRRSVGYGKCFPFRRSISYPLLTLCYTYEKLESIVISLVCLPVDRIVGFRKRGRP
ncbi:MAG: hypothetical protein LBG58_05535, partial [Planctomycetaceae bacterium]|nr:hypothetical protein [Planctomycetaceae bacterium]